MADAAVSPTPREASTTCAACKATPKEKERFKRCARCHGPYYCGPECQKQDWPTHKLSCNPASPSQQQNTTQVPVSTPAPINNQNSSSSPAPVVENTVAVGPSVAQNASKQPSEPKPQEIDITELANDLLRRSKGSTPSNVDNPPAHTPRGYAVEEEDEEDEEDDFRAQMARYMGKGGMGGRMGGMEGMGGRMDRMDDMMQTMVRMHMMGGGGMEMRRPLSEEEQLDLAIKESLELEKARQEKAQKEEAERKQKEEEDKKKQDDIITYYQQLTESGKANLHTSQDYDDDLLYGDVDLYEDEDFNNDDEYGDDIDEDQSAEEGDADEED